MKLAGAIFAKVCQGANGKHRTFQTPEDFFGDRAEKKLGCTGAAMGSKKIVMALCPGGKERIRTVSTRLTRAGRVSSIRGRWPNLLVRE
jgi:hypothetical protein